jgi:hypothetical protein
MDTIENLRVDFPGGKQLHATQTQKRNASGVMVTTDTYLYQEDGRVYLEQWDSAQDEKGKVHTLPEIIMWLKPEEILEFADKLRSLGITGSADRS